MAGSNEILLVRHGETDDNAARRFQGRIDTRLNERGRRQAQALAARLRGEGLRALYASPLLRARETALIVGAELGLDVRCDGRLVEVDAGDWEGLSIDAIAAADPRGLERWRAADPTFRVPGGESVAEQAARSAAALADVAAGPLPALVVAHSGVMRTVAGLDPPIVGRIANCAVHRLAVPAPSPP